MRSSRTRVARWNRSPKRSYIFGSSFNARASPKFRKSEKNKVFHCAPICNACIILVGSSPMTELCAMNYNFRKVGKRKSTV